MSDWTGSNFGVALKALAAAVEPGRPALIHGDQIIDWQELDVATDAIASGLVASGLAPGDVVGHQMRNGPDYVLAFLACCKAGLVHVNLNYHYRGRELADILTRFGTRAIVQDAEFAEVLASARALGAPDCPTWTAGPEGSFHDLAHHPAKVAPTIDPDAQFFVATGGTTGMPKAVMWRQADAWGALSLSLWPSPPGQPPRIATSLAEQVALAVANPPPSYAARSPSLILSPMMHGVGLFSTIVCLMHGGTVVTMPATRFDADQAIDTIAREKVMAVNFVGDAFAMPLAEAVEARADGIAALASVRVFSSSGAAFSPETKARLFAINPDVAIIDALGSSEGAGAAAIVTTANGVVPSGFVALPGRTLKIFDEAFEELPPGSPEFGILARSGPLPLGYFGEGELNARTFPTVRGVRYLMTGDRARLTAEGKIEFAGRDNMCINSGGEKIFPEEVEAVLQRHPAVRDARVVGSPDPRFGKRVVAVVEADADDDLASALEAHARADLAAYKVPRRFVFTQASLRLNNGKPDYKTAQRLAEEAARA